MVIFTKLINNLKYKNMLKKKVKAVLVNSYKPVVLGDIMKCVKRSPMYDYDIDKKIGELVLNINPRVIESNEYFKKQEIVFISMENDVIKKGDKVYFGSELLVIEETTENTVTFINPLDNKLQTLCGIERFKKVIVEHDQISSLDISKLIEKFNNKENTELYIEMYEGYDCTLDKYGNKILEGDFVDLQNNFVQVFSKNNQLAVFVHNKEYYLHEFFRNDYSLCDSSGYDCERENDCELKQFPELIGNEVNILYICEILEKKLFNKDDLFYILKQYEIDKNGGSDERVDRTIKHWLSQFE